MSGRLINVRRDNPDTFYRYKMEPLQTKIEGKGNGIKTVVVNLSSVAQSLARPGSYLIKYFGFELGAQTNIDPADDRWIINGAHDSAKLQDYLDGFINKFVLCKKCKNPETDVQIKDGHITLDCKACGQRTDVDLRLKLSGFILKNQPKKGKKDKAERKAARKAKANGNKENSASGDDNSDQASPNGDNVNKELEYASDDDAMTRKIKTEAQGLREDRDVEVNDDDWAVDMSEEAVKARQRSLPSDFQAKLVLNGDDDDEEGEGGGNTVYDQLGEWIQEQAKEKGGVDKVDDIDVYVKAKELGVETKHRTVLVLVQTLFDENVSAQIGKRASMLKRVSGQYFLHVTLTHRAYANLFGRSSTAPSAMRRPCSEAPSVFSALSARTTTTRSSRSSSCTTTTSSPPRMSSRSGAPRPARSTSTCLPPRRSAALPSPSSSGSRRPRRRRMRTTTTSKLDLDGHCADMSSLWCRGLA
jgi:translation initiation factor 5